MKRTSTITPAPARRWLAHPTLSIMLAVCWLLLQQSLALPQLISAALLGWLLPWLVDGFLVVGVAPGKPRRILMLFGTVIWDVLESNLAVARIVLSPRSNPRPAWIKVPMEIRHPIGQIVLASIITNTPGTVSCKIDEDSHDIVVHVLDCDDGAALIARIKRRYEEPLKEILG